MKKKIYAIVIALLVIASVTTITVLAKTFKDENVERKMAQGYTKEEVYSMLAIISLSDEKSMPVIEQKYKELGSFEALIEYYNIKPINFEMNLKNMMELEEKTAIPDEIYNEMIESGMTEEECKQLSISALNAKFDIETVWEGKKNGKSVNDLIQERRELNDQKAQAATDYTFGLITEEEYTKKMMSLSPDMPMSEIIEFAAKDRKEWRELRIKSSGISEQEIALAEKSGITDIFEMCRLKDAEKLSNKSFNEMVLQVRSGNTVDSVIKANISTEKIESAKEVNASE